MPLEIDQNAVVALVKRQDLDAAFDGAAELSQPARCSTPSSGPRPLRSPARQRPYLVGPLPVSPGVAAGHVVARQAVISPPTTIRAGPIRSPPAQSGGLGGLLGPRRRICPGESGSLRGRGGGLNDGLGDAADEIRDGRHGYPAQQRPV